MKKHKIILTMALICCLMFGSVITTQAATTGARATRYGLTTNEGNYVAYNDMVCKTGYEYTLSMQQTDTYKDYTNYTILHYVLGNEEVYNIVFVKDGQSTKYDPLSSGGYYYPRIRCTNTQAIYYLAVRNMTDNTWTIETKDHYQYDKTVYDSYDITTSEGAAAWTKEHIVYTSADVMAEDGTTVFLKAPKLVLAPMMGTVPMKGATGQILAMVPIAMSLLVCWAGLRKGLAILQRILRNA